jgi:hypothetical protein
MTRAERLDAIIATVAPERHAHQRDTGEWMARPGDERPDRYERQIGKNVWQIDKALTASDAAADPEHIRRVRREAAPYELLTLARGRRRVIVYGEDGSSLAGNGGTLDEAIADLEQKLGIQPKE